MFDIITKYYGESGTGKIHTANIENRYFKELSVGQFSTAYNAYSESQIGRHENNRQIPIQKRMIASFKADLKITNLPANKKDLTFKMIKFLYTQEGLTINDSTFLKNEELLDEDGNYNIQAELLADENRFSIKVVRFEGNDKGTKILLRNEYGYQYLIAAMKNAQNFCAEVVNQTKTVFHENGYREDVPLFDKGAFREAWYNACLHNDWVDGTPPAIYIFNNRLEIISTGGLPDRKSVV